MRRAFFFIGAFLFAATSFASIPRASLLDDAPPIADTLFETRIRVSEVLAPFEWPRESELTRAVRQAYADPSTTNASGLRCFLSLDPTWGSTDLVSSQSWNRYAYVRNNPLSTLDPDGRVDLELAKAMAQEGAKALGATVIEFVADYVLPDGGSDMSTDADKPPRPNHLEQRATENHGALSPDAQRRTTTAVAEVKDADGRTQTLVASSEKKLRPAQIKALRAGEKAVEGAGHAEQTIIDAAATNGQKVEALAASRPICPLALQQLKRWALRH